MSQKQVMPKSEDLSRSLEINAIWTFDMEFPTIFNKSCTYITFKSAVKHRQLGYGYPRGQSINEERKIEWTHGPFSVLGIIFSTNLELISSLNFYVKLRELQNIISQ